MSSLSQPCNMTLNVFTHSSPGAPLTLDTSYDLMLVPERDLSRLQLTALSFQNATHALVVCGTKSLPSSQLVQVQVLNMSTYVASCTASEALLVPLDLLVGDIAVVPQLAAAPEAYDVQVTFGDLLLDAAATTGGPQQANLTSDVLATTE